MTRVVRALRGVGMEKGAEARSCKVAAVIVDRKTLFFLFFAVLAVLRFSRNWVNVNDDITSYLAKDTETRRGLDIMESGSPPSPRRTSWSPASPTRLRRACCPGSEAVDGVHSVEFDATQGPLQKRIRPLCRHLRRGYDLPVSEGAMDEIKASPRGLRLLRKLRGGKPRRQTIKSEMVVVLGIAIFIIVAVLLFTSNTYGNTGAAHDLQGRRLLKHGYKLLVQGLSPMSRTPSPWSCSWPSP